MQKIKKVSKICEHKYCRKRIEKGTKSKYCVEHRRHNKSEVVVNNCEVCGKETTNKKFCSRACQKSESDNKAITRFLQHPFGFYLYSVSQRKGYQTLQGNTSETLEQLYQLHREMRSRNRSLATIDDKTPRTYQLCHLHPLSKGGATHPQNLVIGTAAVNNRLKANDYGWDKYVPCVDLPDTFEKLTSRDWFTAVNNMLGGELLAFVRERRFYQATVKEEYSNHPDNLTKFEDGFFFLEFPVAEWEVAHSIDMVKVDTELNWKWLVEDFKTKHPVVANDLLPRLKRYEQEYLFDTDTEVLETLFFSRFNVKLAA